MASPFVHMELNTTDLPAAKTFYGELFGWTFNDTDMGGGMIYSLFKPDAAPGGGMMAISDAPAMWMGYVGVDDIEAATMKAKSLGAEVIRGPIEVPGQGWMSVLKDPTGVVIAIWQGRTV